MKKFLTYFKIPAVKSNPVSGKTQDENEITGFSFAEKNSYGSEF